MTGGDDGNIAQLADHVVIGVAEFAGDQAADAETVTFRNGAGAGA